VNQILARYQTSLGVIPNRYIIFVGLSSILIFFQCMNGASTESDQHINLDEILHDTTRCLLLSLSTSLFELLPVGATLWNGGGGRLTWWW
jgi:hypothetical protein